LLQKAPEFGYSIFSFCLGLVFCVILLYCSVLVTVGQMIAWKKQSFQNCFGYDVKP